MKLPSERKTPGRKSLPKGEGRVKISASVRPELRAWVEQQALAHEVTLSRFIEQALEAVHAELAEERAAPDTAHQAFEQERTGLAAELAHLKTALDQARQEAQRLMRAVEAERQISAEARAGEREARALAEERAVTLKVERGLREALDRRYAAEQEARNAAEQHAHELRLKLVKLETQAMLDAQTTDLN